MKGKQGLLEGTLPSLTLFLRQEARRELGQGGEEVVLPGMEIWNILEGGDWTILQALEEEVCRPADSGNLCLVSTGTVTRWEG